MGDVIFVVVIQKESDKRTSPLLISIDNGLYKKVFCGGTCVALRCAMFKAGSCGLKVDILETYEQIGL